ncbi:MAG: CDP-alcohol phosphatidyltransferase family protein [Kofleriaceae bacterium]
MWLAHALTLSRIPIALAIVVCHERPMWSLGLLVMAALTDTADGHVARWMQRRGHVDPEIGGWLDPLVDKVFVAIVLAVVWSHTHDAALIAVIGLREILILPLIAAYVARGGVARDVHADPLGKATTIAQFVAIALALSRPEYAWPAAIVAGLLGVAAIAHYGARERRNATISEGS